MWTDVGEVRATYFAIGPGWTVSGPAVGHQQSLKLTESPGICARGTVVDADPVVAFPLDGNVEAKVDAGKWAVGKFVATSGDTSGTVNVLKVPELTPVRELTPHDGRVSSVAFVDGGRSIVSAGWDGSVRLLEIESGKTSCLTVPK